MGPLPIDPPATQTALKPVMLQPRSGWDRELDERFGYLAQFGVASQAAREGRDFERAEALDHFHELLLRIGFTNEGAVRHDATFEKRTIARQQNPPFSICEVRELGVDGAGRTDGVPANETQASCKLAQMSVEDESHGRKRTRPHPRDAGDVYRVKSRKRGDPIAVVHRAVERDRFAIAEHQVDLGMRYTDTLEEILHRRPAGKGHRHVCLPPSRWQKVV